MTGLIKASRNIWHYKAQAVLKRQAVVEWRRFLWKDISHYHKGSHSRWFQWVPGFVPWGQPAEQLQLLTCLHRQPWAWEQEPPRPHNPAQTSANSTACCPSPLEPSLNVHKSRISVAFTPWWWSFPCEKLYQPGLNTAAQSNCVLAIRRSTGQYYSYILRPGFYVSRNDQ